MPQTETQQVDSDAAAADLAAAGMVGGLVLSPYQVLVRPLVTEKGVHRASRNNQYAFEVHPQADKLAVKSAIEELFNVRVLKVRTQTRKGKPRRYRFKLGRTKDWKKAIVTLHSEDRIDFF